MVGTIELKTPAEIDAMRKAGAVLARIRDRVGEEVRPGVTTLELDRLAKKLIKECGGKAAFLGYQGFPGALCTSVNEEIVHGIPSGRVLEEGDILSMDIGLFKDGFFTDTARTFPVGEIDDEARRLIDVTEKSLALAIEQLVPGKRLGDMSSAVQRFVESNGFSVVREYAGHGIGRNLHEDPRIPNHGLPGKGIRWKAGMVVAVEPMVNAGTYRTRVLDDDWTVVTEDGRRSAHHEHTIAITDDGPLILTAGENIA